MKRKGKQLIQDTYRVHCEQTAEREPLIKVPRAVMTSMLWQVGDLIEWRRCRDNTWVAVNLSIRVLYASQFRRDQRSLSRTIFNPNQNLYRVYIQGHVLRQASIVLAPRGGVAFEVVNDKRTQKRRR